MYLAEIADELGLNEGGCSARELLGLGILNNNNEVVAVRLQPAESEMGCE